jgi:hypothetical protein
VILLVERLVDRDALGWKERKDEESFWTKRKKDPFFHLLEGDETEATRTTCDRIFHDLAWERSGMATIKRGKWFFVVFLEKEEPKEGGPLHPSHPQTVENGGVDFLHTRRATLALDKTRQGERDKTRQGNTKQHTAKQHTRKQGKTTQDISMRSKLMMTRKVFFCNRKKRKKRLKRRALL